jgi:hypothetical protein
MTWADVFSPYLLVLLLTAVAAVLVAHHSAETFHHAQEVKAYPSEVRRTIVFGLVFDAAVAAALAAAVLIELLATPVRLVRRRPVALVLLRLIVSLLPLAVLGVGTHLFNPWLIDLLRQARGVVGA